MSKAKKIRVLPLRPLLKHLGACPQARRWVARKRFDTFQQAVAACDHLDWLEWLLNCADMHGLEERAYLASTAAEREYWDQLYHTNSVGPSNSRLFCQQDDKATEVRRAAYREELGDIWGEVEQRLIRIGLRDGVWGTEEA
jgi:hypothetical protein